MVLTAPPPQTPTRTLTPMPMLQSGYNKVECVS